MIRFLRTTASILVALSLALIGIAWSHVPHARRPDPGHEISATFDTVVGFVDLRLRGDIRGYHRLVDLDPRLDGVGGDAARHVAGSDRFTVAERTRAARRLAIQRPDDGIDRELANELAHDLPPEALEELREVDALLDAAVEAHQGCGALAGINPDEMSDTCG